MVDRLLYICYHIFELFDFRKEFVQGELDDTMQRIVVVDDAEINRELLRNILKDSYEIDMAQDGEEALQKLHRHENDAAALLLDLYMPRMDGFSVIAQMKKDGLQSKIPVLVISGERSVEIEDKCFRMGVSDFIRKPFDPCIVRNRVKNAVELFACKNQLEQKVEEQNETLKKQYRIIQMQAEELKQAKPFNKLMMQYRCAIMEVETKLKVLNNEFAQTYNRNPFESIQSRLKTPESIYDKLRRKGYPITVKNVEKYLSDVAGVRVICSFPDDIYRLAELFARQDDIILLKEKDYIKNPKDNGYRSLHLILNIPVFLSKGKKYMKVELQFRTIAMDFWASLEHKLKYKKDMENAEEIVARLKACAESIEALDYQMQEIRDKIDMPEK
ncbi:GTP pyrophosphokinase YwaC [Lachnospiraceae bacterium]|nr:GTP pyrophosphokinase YwaC [Lachnospiraceae bacterium]